MRSRQKRWEKRRLRKEVRRAENAQLQERSCALSLFCDECGALAVQFMLADEGFRRKALARCPRHRLVPGGHMFGTVEKIDGEEFLAFKVQES
jgi:hypothetical protein